VAAPASAAAPSATRPVDALVEAGDGVHFDANKGTPMREWLSLDPRSGQDWLALAGEALDFARSR